MALPKSTDETVQRMKGNMGAIISCADPKGCEEKDYWSRNDPLKVWRDSKDRTGHYNAILNRDNKRVGCSATKIGKGVCLWCYLTKN